MGETTRTERQKEAKNTEQEENDKEQHWVDYHLAGGLQDGASIA